MAIVKIRLSAEVEPEAGPLEGKGPIRVEVEFQDDADSDRHSWSTVDDLVEKGEKHLARALERAGHLRNSLPPV